jgi:hypothetical protein
VKAPYSLWRRCHCSQRQPISKLTAIPSQIHDEKTLGGCALLVCYPHRSRSAQTNSGIDQSNVAGRESQIQLMAHIYTKASHMLLKPKEALTKVSKYHYLGYRILYLVLGR